MPLPPPFSAYCSAGPSAIHGTGLFAREPIAAGTLIWELRTGFDREFTIDQLEALPTADREAIRRYLTALLPDPHAAEDVRQDFVVRVLEQRFVPPEELRGRFRDYLKQCLRNAAIGATMRSSRYERCGAPGLIAALISAAFTYGS